jgi:hypothetical protein
MPSPKDIKKLLNVARGEKTAKKALDLDELLGRLPKGTREQQLEAELMFKRLAEEKAALYAPTNPPTEKGKAALRDIKNQLRESGKQKFLEPSQVKQRLYHGTNKEIKEFDPKLIGTNDFGWYGPGHYLSADPGTASAYADYEKVLESGKLQANPSEGANVLPLHVQLRNPYYWPKDRPVARSKEESLAIGNELMSQGYDGVVVPNKYQSPEYAEHHEVVVFDPRRIKSAIGNQGAYDIESPDITKAEGGVAHMAKGGKLLKALRKGEQGVEAGKDLQSMVEAARPVTAAERAAAGKLMTEYTASQPTTRMSEALGNVGAEGKKLRVTQADRTAAKYLGGPPFSGLQLIDPRYAEARATWGVKTPGAAKNIANQSDSDILWSTLIGSPFQHKSNEIVFDKLYKAFQKEAKAGNLNEELRAKFNAALEPHFGEGADILDPSLRKEIDTFEKRAIVADLLMGEKLGGALRGGSIIPGGKIMMESTEPMLQGVDTFSIGPRLFTLDRGVTTRPDLHPAFPEILQGEDLRQLFVPVPNEIALPTFNEEFRKRTGRKKPGYYDLTMTPPGEPYPTQDITEKYLSRLQKEGYADGGVVHMQGGGNPGEVSGDMFKPKPLEMPSIFADAAAKLKAQFEKERRSMRKPGAVQDVLMRGPVAMYAGAPADILGMGGEALDYLQTKIPGLRERASVMDTGPERVPTMGYAPKVSLAPEGPYGTEAAQDLLKKAGLTTDEERPLFEMGAGITAPIAGAAALKTGKALAPTARDMLEMQLEKSMKPYQMAVAPEGKAGKVKAPANKVGFYNPAEKAALNLQRKKGPGSAFVSDMQKTPGVNQERLNDLGLGDLASRPDVTRDEILQAAEQNRIPLRESVRRQYQEEDEFSDTLEGLRFNNRYYEDGIQQMQDRIREVSERAPDSPLIAEYERKIVAMQEKIARNNERMASKQPSLYGPDSHPEYNMPGGENYREIRVGLPDTSKKEFAFEAFDPATQRAQRFATEAEAKQALKGTPGAVLSKVEVSESNPAFYDRNHHGDEANVLFHLRVADHTDAEGKRGLLIDELQSDWHQAGREHGYKSGKNELPEGWTVDEDPGKNGMWIVRNNRGQMVSTGLGKFDAIESALGSKGGVPNAPFKDNWYQLGLKRAIKEASDTGMDRVYLTTGNRQTLRYSEDQRKGMEHWYDKQYKNFLDKYAKQFGGKVGETKLSVGKQQNDWPAFREWFAAKYPPGSARGGSGTALYQWEEGANNKFVKEFEKSLGDKYETVYYIDIPPKMRESSKIGQSYKDGGSVSQDGAAPQDLTAHLNNLLRQHHGMAEGGAVNLEEKLNNLLRQHHGMAEGGEVEAPYNADPDMSDRGLFVPAAAFAEGGAVKSIWTVN